MVATPRVRLRSDVLPAVLRSAQRGGRVVEPLTRVERRDGGVLAVVWHRSTMKEVAEASGPTSGDLDRHPKSR